MRVRAVLSFVVVAAACGADPSDPPPGGLATMFDSTGDTIRARVQGVVRDDALLTLRDDWRLSGEVGDSVRFGNAGSITLGADGAAAFVDYSTEQVFLVGSDGTLRGPMGGKGAGPGEYEQVNGLVGLPDGRWALYDVSNSRLSFFGADGGFLTSWPMPASRFFGQGMLDGDADGTLRIAQFVTEPSATDLDARFALARVLDGGLALADSVFAPSYGVKATEYRASASTPGGRSSTMITDQLAASEMAQWHPDGHWVVMEGGTYRLLFDRQGAKPLQVERSAPPIVPDPDERAWNEERVLFVMRRTDPTWRWQGAPIAQTRAPARSVFVGRDGRVWVQVSLPSEPIPEDQRDPVREGAPPPARWRTRSAYEVFGRDGRFLGRVTLPPRASLQAAEGDFVWGTQLDEDDVPTVVRWRVVPGLGS